MDPIKLTTGIAGERFSYPPGEVLTPGKEVSKEDAARLVKAGLAEPQTPAKPETTAKPKPAGRKKGGGNAPETTDNDS